MPDSSVVPVAAPWALLGVVLLGEGAVIADGPAEEILSGGWYFATEVARVLDLPGVITPAQGAAALREGGL